nr:transglycosylase SLT domain-containing protein [Candidatus Kinetoplastibacterium galatii]
MNLDKNISYMPYLKAYCILLCIALMTGCTSVSAGFQSNDFHNIKSAILKRDSKPLDAWDRMRKGFQMPNLNTELSKQWIKYYASHPESIRKIAERSSKYLYFVIEEITRRNLPTELALIPFIESAYNPSAISKNQASGLWQFVPKTAQHFKLKQNWWCDERRDPVISTYAALDYLEKLYKTQGNWHLALASYNCGESTIQKAIARNKKLGLPINYSSLKIPEETRNYVPKIQAIKTIIKNPEKFGIKLPKVSNKPYFSSVKRNKDIDIEIAAKLAEISLEEFKALNPSYNRPIIKGPYSQTILLPIDTIDTFHNNLKLFKGNLSNWKIYKSKNRETFASIAEHFGISEADLRKSNHIIHKQKVTSGQILLIPTDKIKNNIKNNCITSNLIEYEIKTGDTLLKIAKEHNTTLNNLIKINKLKNDKIVSGSKIMVPFNKK